MIPIPANNWTKAICFKIDTSHGKDLTTCLFIGDDWYESMDAAYDAQIIRDFVAASGHVALIDFNHRSKNDTRSFTALEAERYKARSSAERINSYLKDSFSGTMIRVKGHAKIFTHLMFSLLAITINRSLKLIT